VPSILALQRLAVGHGGRACVADIDLEVEAGALVAVLGTNGTGKSTLVRTIVGLQRPISGTVMLDGVPPSRIAYLAQQSDIDRSFPITVIEMVITGLWPRLGHVGGVTKEHRQEARKALDQVGMTHVAERTISELSAGQFQRVLFARTMLQDAPLIVLDEPFMAVDERTVDALIGFIRGWRDEGRTVLVVVHDLGLALKEFPLTILVGGGRAVIGATYDILNRTNLIAAGYWGADGHVLESLLAQGRISNDL